MRQAWLYRDAADPCLLAGRVRVAVGIDALRGLLGRTGMEPQEGLYFPDAIFGALHSIGMRFHFDALYLDRRGRVRRVLPGVRPGRLCPWDLRTAAALELPAGTLAATGVAVGDEVRLKTSVQPQKERGATPEPPRG